jgi:hypothetical protein
MAEFFQRRRTINVRDREAWLVIFSLVRALSMLDLNGLWPTRAGGPQL